MSIRRRLQKVKKIIDDIEAHVKEEVKKNNDDLKIQVQIEISMWVENGIEQPFHSTTSGEQIASRNATEVKRRNEQTVAWNPDPSRLWQMIDDKDEKKRIGTFSSLALDKKTRNPSPRTKRRSNVHRQANLQQEKEATNKCHPVSSVLQNVTKFRIALSLLRLFRANAPRRSSVATTAWLVCLD